MKVYSVTYGWHGEDNDDNHAVIVVAESEDEAIEKFIAHCREQGRPSGVVEGHFQQAWEMQVIQ